MGRPLQRMFAVAAEMDVYVNSCTLPSHVNQWNHLKMQLSGRLSTSMNSKTRSIDVRGDIRTTNDVGPLKAIAQRRNHASLSQTPANKHAPIGGLTRECAIFNLDRRRASAIPCTIGWIIEFVRDGKVVDGQFL